MLVNPGNTVYNAALLLTLVDNPLYAVGFGDEPTLRFDRSRHFHLADTSAASPDISNPLLWSADYRIGTIDPVWCSCQVLQLVQIVWG